MSVDETASELPGLDLPNVERYLREHASGLLAGPLAGTVVEGGRSNLTYRLTDGVSHWALRRPPLGHVLASAHDMGREYTIMSALGDTAVPVPRMITLCDDPSITGAPFYVMEWCEGATYRWRADLEAVGAERTERISRALIETLAELHTVDPHRHGLGEFGRPAGYLDRQVRVWGRQLDASRTRPLSGIDQLRAALERGAPPSARSGIVHGDFRLDNVLVDETDAVVAVLDWEMATLGDPLMDLAMLLAYDGLARVTGGQGIADASTAPGFLTQDEIVEVYAHHSGADVSDLSFHLALAFYKLAVILEGIHVRHVKGQTVGGGFDRVGDLVPPAIEAGLTAIKE